MDNLLIPIIKSENLDTDDLSTDDDLELNAEIYKARLAAETAYTEYLTACENATAMLKIVSETKTDEAMTNYSKAVFRKYDAQQAVIQTGQAAWELDPNFT